VALSAHNLVVCYSSNASFRIISDTAACTVSLLYSWQFGGAISSNLNGLLTITGSSFEGNTSNRRNNVHQGPGTGSVTCNDGTNTFESSGGGEINGPDGNSPAGLCG